MAFLTGLIGILLILNSSVQCYSNNTFYGLNSQNDQVENNYKNYCAGCHGDKLEKFADQNWMFAKSPEEIAEIISKGEADMGMPEGYPTTTEVTVLLEDLGGRTRMVMTHAGMPADSGAGGGWEQAFDKLVDHIETVLNDK